MKFAIDAAEPLPPPRTRAIAVGRGAMRGARFGALAAGSIATLYVVVGGLYYGGVILYKSWIGGKIPHWLRVDTFDTGYLFGGALAAIIYVTAMGALIGGLIIGVVAAIEYRLCDQPAEPHPLD